MRRYMVVTHHVDNETLALKEGKVMGGQPIHDLVSGYHWVRLDDEHILMVSDYPISNHARLHKHQHVSVLPHTGSHKKLHKHINESGSIEHGGKHIQALHKCLGITDEHTIEDLIEEVVYRHGAIFSPHT